MPGAAGRAAGRAAPAAAFPRPGALSRGARRAAAPPGELAARFGLDPQQPWLLAVAMMRADVKRESYLLLADGARPAARSAWQLLVVGDGPARAEVEAVRGPGQVGSLRRRAAGGRAAAVYAAADLYVWPAVREAYGLAMLEAQAAGLPVVAGREGGVAEVVADGVSGC